MPQENNNDPFNNARNLDIDPTNNPTNSNDDNDTIDRPVMIDDGLNPGFQREERPSPDRDIPTIEGAANIRDRFPSDHERLMSRINLGDALIKRENTHFGRFER
ncbi:hypothetical protein UP17_20170 [Peribacillus simplex]|uniref:hypothetical protein n=1 Tax=Peribacillus simplex TaxID=1478 RepID=UPI0007775530|nr:hypothetical protein [Peribacillus simplex]AMM94510.1 hypothetical protein UP17_20170 [Peribacillus simplex]